MNGYVSCINHKFSFNSNVMLKCNFESGFRHRYDCEYK